MAKGIRTAVNHTFLLLSAKRLAGEFGDISSGTLSEGNKAFRKEVMCFAIDTFGINIASAATAYNHAFKNASKIAPELVVGLGRSEDKKGGRKPGIKNASNTTVEEVIEVKTYTVARKKDGVIQGTDLTLEAAQAMVDKAFKGKKAALVIQ